QHLRTRTGYAPEEITSLNAALEKQDLHLNRVLCRIPPNTSPWDTVQALETYSHIAHIDLSVELSTQNDSENAARIAEACFATATLPTSKLFIAPYNDLDRTMDAIYGLLDTLCNPRPAFQTLRTLNTLLFSPIYNQDYRPQEQEQAQDANHRLLILHAPERTLKLLIPHKTPLKLSNIFNDAKNIEQHNLTTGEISALATTLTTPDPILIIT
ncbi:MAG: hypothetical protein HN521_21410, partial [Candidatus Latescibacteria bacterium]|nr:hypothetical protein [Candidatus Latescibacterota bacterium]